MSLLSELPTAAWIGFAAFLGAWVGSFLNVVVHRLPRMIAADEAVPTEKSVYNLAWPGSHCPTCSSPVRMRHNLPLVGWLSLRGRCADCRAPISVRYPLLELAAAFACGLAVVRFGANFQCIAAVVVLCSLLALAVIDLEHYLLPDAIVLPLLWLGLIVNSFDLFIEAEEAVLSAAASYAGLRLLAGVWTRLRGVESLGRGDCKLAAVVGAWLGLEALAEVLVLASVGTVVVGILKGLRSQDPLPFGPGIAAGMAFVLVAHPDSLRVLALDALRLLG